MWQLQKQARPTRLKEGPGPERGLGNLGSSPSGLESQETKVLDTLAGWGGILEVRRPGSVPYSVVVRWGPDGTAHKWAVVSRYRSGLG